MANGTKRNAEGQTQGLLLRRRAEAAIDVTVRAGANAYDRRRDLPGLIRLQLQAGEAEAIVDVEAIVARLESALRAERNRARSGHWTYDLNRHIALLQAHRAERERLTTLKADH
ncbi:MAG: DUF6477 family protein [Propylenella sp.]